ncbi:hypothetical protein DIPPA_20467 [Diplonema papillatum]|nr:hypothetical protein DIPPA_20467 [Diplonema papillatum]
MKKKKPKYEPVADVTVDLDAKPADRWKAAVETFRAPLTQLMGMLETAGEQLGEARMTELHEAWKQALRRHGAEHYEAELQGIADTLRVRPAVVALGQLEYDLAVSGCTSLLFRMGNAVVLARTLDWDAALAPLACNAVFMRGGTPVAECPTFAGFVGVTTGTTRAGECVSIALNSRPERVDTKLREKDVTKALDGRYAVAVAALRQGGSWPIAVLMREVLIKAATGAAPDPPGSEATPPPSPPPAPRRPKRARREEDPAPLRRPLKKRKISREPAAASVPSAPPPLAGFDGAVATLAAAPLISSAYFLVASGARGAVIQRDSSADAGGAPGDCVAHLGPEGNATLVQCNHDVARSTGRYKAADSVARQAAAQRFVGALKRPEAGAAAAGAVERSLVSGFFSRPPAFAPETVLFTLAVPQWGVSRALRRRI